MVIPKAACRRVAVTPSPRGQPEGLLSKPSGCPRFGKDTDERASGCRIGAQRTGREWRGCPCLYDLWCFFFSCARFALLFLFCLSRRRAAVLKKRAWALCARKDRVGVPAYMNFGRRALAFQREFHVQSFERFFSPKMIIWV